jgi:phospholipid-binding lipoprotein MlaA
MTIRMRTRIEPKKLRLAAISLLALALLGCATVPPSERNPRDPWQRMNRATYRFDLGFYKRILIPVVTNYVRVTPHPIQAGVHNFVGNLFYPTVIVNALLQGKVLPFARDLGRLVVNTTVGIGGLFDPASRLGLTPEDRDFGQTFGKWGVPMGPYLVLPFLGPSDVRDALGLVPDYTVASPLDYGHYPGQLAIRLGVDGLDVLNTGVELLPELQLDLKAYDPYGFARNAYLQERAFMVKGAKAENGPEEELKELQQGP